MKTTRTNEIKNRMTAFRNGEFTREEQIAEFIKLQNEMAVITYGETGSEEKRFYDIANYLTDLNNEKNFVSQELIKAFRKECCEATDCIKGGISGCKGERRTFERLDRLLSTHRIRKNIEISNEEYRTEIDALVVTEKAAFIIEVKNTKKDVFIDENGQYFRTGEYLNWDSNIGAKLALRESFVRGRAETVGIKNLEVVKIVVFTENRISVQNRCKNIITCFLNQITAVIDAYKGDKVITFDEMDSLVNSIDSISTVSRYAPKMDVERFKADFAEIVSALEYHEEDIAPMVNDRNPWVEFLVGLVFKLASC